jgi:hypothetical protein
MARRLIPVLSLKPPKYKQDLEDISDEDLPEDELETSRQAIMCLFS